MKIMIDAGHGGRDPGAVGPSGLEEAEVALAIAAYLYDELRSLDYEVVMTRWSDEFVALPMRCEMANDAKADIFLSVHLNSNGPSAVGIETLYSTSEGKAVAEPVHKALIKATGDRDRGLKERDNLHVLNGTDMPAILVEVGFISHPDTEKKFRSPDYRKLLAQAIREGLSDFQGEEALA
jgi:N-acetylmuramoyl-L-alanine amidase